MDFLDDPQLKTRYEDTYTFTLDSITFTIRCKIDALGVVYFPDALKSTGERASGRMLRWQNAFNDLNFVRPPAWLVNAISPDYSMFTEAQRARPRQGEPAQPPELYIPLWELPHIQGKLRHWAREHPFIGRQRDLVRSWKSRRGLIEVCKYELQDTHHLEICVYDVERKQYREKTRIAGSREQLEAVGATMAQVAGAREQKIRAPKPAKKTRKVIPFPS